MIEYAQDLAPGWTDEQANLVEAHVRAELSAVADADDDPETNADDVDVIRTRVPDGALRITGYLDATPTAAYLEPGYDPLAGVDPALYAAEVTAAQRDEEVLRGTP